MGVRITPKGKITFQLRYRYDGRPNHGEGLSVELNALPVNGRIVLMPPKAADSTEGAEVAR